MVNIILGDNSNFEGGTLGNWNSWGDNSPTREISIEGEGFNSKYCLILDNPIDGDDYYKAQACFQFDKFLEAGKTYILQFVQKQV